MKRFILIFSLLMCAFYASAQTSGEKQAALQFIESNPVCVVNTANDHGLVKMYIGNHTGKTIKKITAVWDNGSKEVSFEIDCFILSKKPYYVSRAVGASKSQYKLKSLTVNIGLTEQRTYTGKELQAITLPEDLRRGAGL